MLDNHIKNSKKHSAEKKRLANKGRQEKDIIEALGAKRASCGRVSASELQVCRVKVSTTFLRAGIPINKLDQFRELLEENGLRLAGRRRFNSICSTRGAEKSQKIN